MLGEKLRNKDLSISMFEAYFKNKILKKNKLIMSNKRGAVGYVYVIKQSAIKNLAFKNNESHD